MTPADGREQGPHGRARVRRAHGRGLRPGPGRRLLAAPVGGAAEAVKTHLLHIYAKLNVNDRAAAVATAFERGLLPTSRRT